MKKLLIMLLGLVIVSSIIFVYLSDEIININQNSSDYKCPNCNVILISIDSLRADHMSTYGYNRDTTPNLNSLSEKSIIFEKAYSQSPYSGPSHMTLFTSLYPSVHKIKSFQALNDPSTQSLSPSIITLPMILQKEGYTNFGRVGGASLKDSFGFENGFVDYYMNDLLWWWKLKINDDVDFKDSRLFNLIEDNKENKFFIFFHTFSTHYPYTSSFEDKFSEGYESNIPSSFDELSNSEGFKDIINLSYSPDLSSSPNGIDIKSYGSIIRSYFNFIDENNIDEDVNQIKNLYDSSIFYTDANLQLLFDKLEELNLMNNTIIIITSANGEEFLDHGEIGRKILYNEHLHIPLIIMLPSGISKRVDNNVGLIDLMPTLLDILDIDSNIENYDLQGRSLTDSFYGQLEDLPIFSKTANTVSIRTNRYTFIKNEGSIANQVTNMIDELYDISIDPYEKNNIIVGERDIVMSMKEEIKNFEDASRQYSYLS